jgi:hypothetical protein
MNERIKELVGQAKFMAEETINRQISKNAELDAFAEKFAELIVRECMNVLAESREVRQTAYYYRNRIAKHFGVAE